MHWLAFTVFTLSLPSLGAATDQLTVARCRSFCISRLQAGARSGRLDDSRCGDQMNCNICWDHCYNLADDWDKWSPVCVEKQLEFCQQHPGCSHACAIMSDMSPAASHRQKPAVSFRAPSLAFKQLTGEMTIAWRIPGSHDVLVSWVFFQESGRLWQPLVQTLNSSIQIHVNSAPHHYSFCVLLVDRHGVLTQSPVVRVDESNRVRILPDAFQLPTEIATADHVEQDPLEDKWRSLLSDLKSLNRRLTNSTLTRSTVRLQDSEASSLSLLLSVTLGGVSAVVLLLIAITCYFQRYQSKQLAEMRASFHAWSGRLGSSFRSSFHVARQSFRRRSARASPAVPTATESGEALKLESEEAKEP